MGDVRSLMFIEITEYLQCPADHAPAWLVLAPDRIERRHVVAGAIGCPVCRAEYAIRDGVVRFGAVPGWPPDAPLPAPDVVQALVGLESPGGVIVLVGSAARLAAELGPLLSGVHLVLVNAAEPVDAASHLEATGGIPLRDRVARGVVLGAEARAWLPDARRVVLPGQRVVVLTEDVAAVEGLEELARGDGLWVGRRR